MSELHLILLNACENSLVLGDELCSGTENISALAIFSSSVIKLCERNTNFIFATHLHDLCKIPQIMELDLVKMFHLKVIFNKETGELVYDRKLEEGNGPTIYGLEVCRAMDMDNDFLMLSEKIRKQIVGEKDSILSATKSHYNSKVFLDKCGICGEYGHGQIECNNPGLKTKLQQYHNDKLLCVSDYCALEGCRHPWSHKTIAHHCGRCNRNHHSSKCIIQPLQTQIARFYDLTSIDKYERFFERNPNGYVISYVGMGCDMYIKLVNGI